MNNSKSIQYVMTTEKDIIDDLARRFWRDIRVFDEEYRVSNFLTLITHQK